MSKKILSVLLAVVMIITASFGGMTVSAEGLTNYVGDGGFENADFSGTIPNYGTGSSTDMATWGRFSSGVTRMELVTSDNYSGDDSVALNGNKYMKSGVTTDGAYIRGFGQRLELTAGDYLLTFIAKSDAGNLFSAGIYPTTEASIDVNKAIAYTYLDATNYWKEYTVDFSVPSDGIYYLMIGGNTDGDNNIRLFYMDNVAVYAKSDIVIVNAVATAGGTVTGGGVAAKGDTVTLTATAKSGYEFAGWSDGETAATRTVTAENGATYHANFTRKLTANLIIDGDFEADEWAVSEAWNTVNSNDKTFTKATESGNTYAVTTPETKQSLASDIITVKPGETYTLTFDSMFIDSGKTLTGDMNGFYRYGFIEATQTALGGGAFTALAGNNYASFSPGAMSDARFGVWETVTKEYTNNTDADVSVKAVIGYYNDECGYEWRVDNVVLSKASDYGVGKTVVGGFENGTDGWTASEGATITTANTADTALGSFKKYLGNNIGVLNPAAEGDTFTSPAFATESGKTYDVVIYTRHNSADDARGAFSFTAGGDGEVMKQANYGKPANDSEIGKYENNDGFMVVPDNANKDNFVSSTFVKLIFTFTATANSHNITITTLTPVSAFIDGFEVYCHDDFVKLAKDSLGFKGTAIRITGVQGLRFKNTINVDALKNFGNYAKVVEYGTLAIKEVYKKGAITFENLTDGTYEYTKSGGTVGSYLKCGVAYNVETNTDTVFASNLYAKDFTGVLIGITEENYSANYVTRAYAKVQFADGSYTYVYGDEQVASITAVAQHIVNNNLESEAVREYLTTNILG